MRATSGLVSRHIRASYEKVHFFIRVRYGLDPYQNRAGSGPDPCQNRARPGLDPIWVGFVLDLGQMGRIQAGCAPHPGQLRKGTFFYSHQIWAGSVPEPCQNRARTGPDPAQIWASYEKVYFLFTTTYSRQIPLKSVSSDLSHHHMSAIFLYINKPFSWI